MKKIVKCCCGCGDVSPMATYTSKIYGWIKGQPKKFIHGHNRRNVKVSNETRLKLSKSNKGQIPWTKGKHHTIETRHKISLANKGHRLTPEQLLKQSLAHTGFKVKKQTKIKISNKLKQLYLSGERTKIKPMLGKNHSIETRRKMQLSARSGDKSSLWRGGVYEKNKLARTSSEYKIWRKMVFDRDDYTCVLCGRRGKKGDRVILQADHIKPWAFYPELHYDINNGRTLCVECHRKTETYAINFRYAKTGKIPNSL